jgi:hypothetical protein
MPATRGNLGIRQLEWIITQNGHLALEGDESKDDLRRAILYLYDHDTADCRNATVGTSIEDFDFDLTRLIPNYYRRLRTARATGVKFNLIDLLDMGVEG